jgi:hypothetical protein
MAQQGPGRQRARKPDQLGRVILVAAGLGFLPGQADRARVTVTAPRGVSTDKGLAATVRDKNNYIIPVTPGA